MQFGALPLSSPAMPFVAALVLSVLVQLGKRQAPSKDAIPNTLVSAGMWIVGALLFGSWADSILGWVRSSYDALGIPRLPPTIWADVPVPVTLLILTVVHDFCDYWNHRFMHLRWVFPVHAVHHSDVYVDGMTTFRVHAVEWLVMQTSFVLLMSWLGAPTLPAAALAFLIMLHNCYVHLDLDWTHGPFRYVLASPRFHRWHHVDAEIAYGKNLANIFPIFDRMFGTYIDPGPCTGPLGARKAGIPSTHLPKLLVWPLIGWARLLRESWSSVTLRRAPAPVGPSPDALVGPTSKNAR
jgi:sterol desaturase/sphingolipid hydroxylase (fatty acid hydroxylase superfamily)